MPARNETLAGQGRAEEITPFDPAPESLDLREWEKVIDRDFEKLKELNPEANSETRGLRITI